MAMSGCLLPSNCIADTALFAGRPSQADEHIIEMVETKSPKSARAVRKGSQDIPLLDTAQVQITCAHSDAVSPDFDEEHGQEKHRQTLPSCSWCKRQE